MMNWTTDKPAKPGSYWWRLGSDRLAHLVKVTIDGDGVLSTHPPAQLVEAGRFLDTTGEWFGPVEHPQ